MTLDLTEQQVNYIAFALAQRPYGEVAELVNLIQQQAQQQQEPQQEPQQHAEDTRQQLRPVA